MAKRITIDPITRIEGHLRIDVEVDNNAVSNAWASCTMWRGIEKILRGRDPRDAWLFTQRFCGVCTTVHAMASVRSVEDALEAGDSAQRPVHPQSHPDCARVARPHRALLSTVGAGLGGHSADSQSRSGGDGEIGGEPLALDAQFPQRVQGRAGPGECRRQPADSSAFS